MFKPFIMQIKREYWENKKIIFVLPCFLGALFVFALIAGITYGVNSSNIFTIKENGHLSFSFLSGNYQKINNTVENTDWKFDSQLIDKQTMKHVDTDFFVKKSEETYPNKPPKANVVHDNIDVNINNGTLFNVTANGGYKFGFEVVLILLSVLILVGSMSSDRKDGSIYFWRSLPVSETRHVLTKLFVATVVLSSVYYFIITVTIMITAVCLSIFQWLYLPEQIQQSFINITATWQLLSEMFITLLTTIFGMLLALPLLGWAMVCSAWVKRFSLLLMLLPIVIIFVMEDLIFSTNNFMGIFQRYITTAMDVMFLMRSELVISPHFYHLLPGILFGIALIIGSIYIRRCNID